MILRKPYAFLIKHFKLIHIILTLLLSYIFYKSMNLLTFFNEYISANQMTIISGGEAYLFNGFIFLALILSILIAIIIAVLMFNKKKPLLYYFSLIIGYLILFIFLLYTKGQVHTLEQELIDIRIISMIRDVLIAVVVIQFFFIIISLIRGVGFDVKKFNFKEDLEELDINEEDREEIEVAIKFDLESYKTIVKRKFRYLKYNLIENKMLIIILIFILISIIGGIIFYGRFNKNKVYSQGTYINPLYYSLTIKDAYLTQRDYQGNVIDKNKTFVILNTNVRKTTTSNKTLYVARMAINVDNYRIYPTTDYVGSFRDIGYEYNSYELSSQYTSYILVYEIPKQFLNKKMFFEYTDINNKVYRIALNYINLDIIKEEKEIGLNNQIELNNTILGDSFFSFEGVEMNDQFKIDYELCVSDNECYQFYENIYPDLSSNYDRTLIKLKLNLNMNSYYKKLSINDFVNYFASINYEIDGKKYITNMKQIKTKKVDTKDLYLSVNSNIKQATSINLEFNIRNYKYVYKVK